MSAKPYIILDVFSGTGSVSKAADFFDEKTIKVISLDKEKKHDPDICVDFMDWDYKSFLTNNSEVKDNLPLLVWISPPCETYSLAARDHHRKKNVDYLGYVSYESISEEAKRADELLKKVIAFTEYLNLLEINWVIENPKGKMMYFLNGMNKHLVYYCQYGFDYPKPTHIFTNCVLDFSGTKCSCGPKGHEGSVTKLSLLQRYSVPINLIIEIIEQLIF